MIDLSTFLEPKGFIKIFQFIFVICAFACTCDFRGEVVLTARCPVTDSTELPAITDAPGAFVAEDDLRFDNSLGAYDDGLGAEGVLRYDNSLGAYDDGLGAEGVLRYDNSLGAYDDGLGAEGVLRFDDALGTGDTLADEATTVDDTPALLKVIAVALGDKAVSGPSQSPSDDSSLASSSSWQNEVEEEFAPGDEPAETTLEPTDPLPETVRFKTTVKYGFKLEDNSAKGVNCNNTAVTMKLEGNYYSPSSFYVFVGVSAMLYTMMAIALYTAFKEYYDQDWVPIVDLAIHFAYTIMWFAGSIAWAVAVTSIKNETKSTTVIHNNPAICSDDGIRCSVTSIKWQLLDFSIVFGFLNFVLYLVNMWFIFKETTFYAKRASPSS